MVPATAPIGMEHSFLAARRISDASSIATELKAPKAVKHLAKTMTMVLAALTDSERQPTTQERKTLFLVLDCVTIAMDALVRPLSLIQPCEGPLRTHSGLQKPVCREGVAQPPDSSAG